MSSQVPRAASHVCRLCRLQQISTRSHQSLLIIAEQSPKPKQYNFLQTRAISSRTSPKAISKSSGAPSPSSRIPQTSLRPSNPIQKEVAGSQSTTKQSVQTVQVKSSGEQSREAVTPQAYQKQSLSAPKNVIGASESFQRIQSEVNAVAAAEYLPDQSTVLGILDQSYQLANVLVFGQTAAPEEQAVEEDNGDSNLLSDLEESSTSITSTKSSNVTSQPVNIPMSQREKLAVDLCQTIYDLLKDPKIAIDEAVLPIYVRIVCQLGRPEYLPEIFYLYAHKPVPIPGTNPIRYSNPNPNSAKNAIPQELCDVALDTAILQRDLPLAITIIDTTVATRAFRTNKFLRKAALPLTLTGTLPLGIYAAADWVANWQNTMDPYQAKFITVTGATAYVGTMVTLLFIALTTFNDHHDRVVWIPGTPLRSRWMREEERLYFDRVAVAWGFQQRARRGEEMGEEWEALRDELGLRSMILDKTDLMDGMQ